MKFLELREFVNTFYERMKDRKYEIEDLTIRIAISSPSMGPSATVEVAGLSLGFDWDRGTMFIDPSKPLVVKTMKQKVWDMAHDHIYRLSRERSVKGNPTSAARWAQQVLDMAADTKEASRDE